LENWAEIEMDSGDDVDSTPGNEIENEDDYDSAVVSIDHRYDLALRKIVTNM
jgi:hypothetical protein